MFGRRSEPKGWQGFSTIKDEEALPPKPKGAWVSAVLAPAVTLIFAIFAGALVGAGVYLFFVGRMFRLMIYPGLGIFSFMIFGVAWSVGVWARAYVKEKQTRYVSEHYKDARPPYKRPESERERAWRERHVERELGLRPESSDNDSGRN